MIPVDEPRRPERGDSLVTSPASKASAVANRPVEAEGTWRSRWGSSWGAYKAAWRVVRADPELLLMPFLGVLLLVALLPVAIGLWVASFALLDLMDLPEGVLVVLILFVVSVPYAWLWVTTFVLLDALVVVTAHERIHGGSPTLASSLRKVGRRLTPLLAWSFSVAFVVSVLAIVARRGGVHRALAGAGGVTLSLATLFVVPHIVLENGSVRGAMKRSGNRVFRRFGPVTGKTIKFGLYGILGVLAFLWIGVPVSGLLVMVLEAIAPGAPVALVVLTYLLPFIGLFLFLALHAVVGSVYKTALYDSMRGMQVDWFPEEALLEPFE